MARNALQRLCNAPVVTVAPQEVSTVAIDQDQPKPRAEVVFVLTVQPESPAAPWHARLLYADGPQQLEFDSPLALVRHLAQLSATQPRRGGLR
jgi:hypothetical protein